ncbi:hypothetical protein BG004_007388, partial [Podila humilis]
MSVNQGRSKDKEPSEHIDQFHIKDEKENHDPGEDAGGVSPVSIGTPHVYPEGGYGWWALAATFVVAF